MASTIVRALLPSGLTGLVLKLYEPGSAVVANTGGDALAEVGTSRLYQATVTEALAGEYVATVESATGAVIGGGYVTLADDAGPYDVDRGASQASVDANGTAIATLTSNGGVASTAPARRAGNRVEVEIVRGDTYADGVSQGALDFDEQSWWPTDLAGATIVLTARVKRGRHDTTDPAVVLTKTGTVVSATTPQEVRVELTAAETAAAAVGTHEYDVQATLSTGEVVTLAGPGWPFVVRADQTV